MLFRVVSTSLYYLHALSTALDGYFSCVFNHIEEETTWLHGRTKEYGGLYLPYYFEQI